MNGQTRRDFCIGISEQLSDRISKITASLGAHTTPEAQPSWISIMKIADLKPGAVISFSSARAQLRVHSSAEGIWALDPDGAHVALRAGPDGTLLANPGIQWPENKILSHSSGEAIDRGEFNS